MVPTEQWQITDKRLVVHPKAGIVPECSPAEYLNLKRNIGDNQQQDPIDWNETTGYVLDGRTRLRVLREKDIGFLTVDVRVVHVQPADEVGYMVHRATDRRHLTPETRAIIIRNIAKEVLWTTEDGKAVGRSHEEIAKAAEVSTATAKRALKGVDHGDLPPVIETATGPQSRPAHTPKPLTAEQKVTAKGKAEALNHSKAVATALRKLAHPGTNFPRTIVDRLAEDAMIPWLEAWGYATVKA